VLLCGGASSAMGVWSWSPSPHAESFHAPSVARRVGGSTEITSGSARSAVAWPRRTVEVHSRRGFCDVPDCPRQIFADLPATHHFFDLHPIQLPIAHLVHFVWWKDGGELSFGRPNPSWRSTGLKLAGDELQNWPIRRRDAHTWTDIRVWPRQNMNCEPRSRSNSIRARSYPPSPASQAAPRSMCLSSEDKRSRACPVD
jgi:hypothetical protein